MEAVQLPGRGRQFRSALLRDVTSVVEHFLNSIENDTPDNIFLFGHSMGAILAFECARALQSSTKTSVKGLFVSACIAPSFPRNTKPIHDLPSPSFKEELKRINGTPKEVINNQELMELIEPILRADFEIFENYIYQDKCRLNTPIYAYSGLEDKLTPYKKMLAWERETRTSFEQKLLPGGHFFIHSESDRVLASLERIILDTN
ncbi:hypothetical protein AMR75_20615 [Vibrio fluvialis]|nr:hypothetical protein AMR75_20615 [Vibrio fluvialis]